MKATVDQVRKAIADYLRENPTLSFTEAAAHWGCSLATVSRIATNAEPPIKPPRLTRIRNFTTEGR